MRLTRYNIKGILCSLCVALALPLSSAHAGLLLQVDLGVTDQITVTATSGTSAATVTGSDTIGVYLAGFFGSDPGGLIDSTSGTLTSALNSSDGTPGIYHGTFPADDGLNIWTFTNDANANFNLGQIAFAGTATWSVATAVYAAALAGATFGDIYFPADTASDLPNAVVLGTWARADTAVVPLPATLALFGIGLVGLGWSRRKKA